MQRSCGGKRRCDVDKGVEERDPKADKRKPEYNATIGQLVCPCCDKDCGGWCEPGDNKYGND